MPQARTAANREKAALEPSAIEYRGAFVSGHRYCRYISQAAGNRQCNLTGDQIPDVVANMLTSARDVDFFSLVCPHVLDTHPRMMLLQAYTPVTKVHMAK
jgi:hypothetical protein